MGKIDDVLAQKNKNSTNETKKTSAIDEVLAKKGAEVVKHSNKNTQTPVVEKPLEEPSFLGRVGNTVGGALKQVGGQHLTGILAPQIALSPENPTGTKNTSGTRRRNVSAEVQKQRIENAKDSYQSGVDLQMSGAEDIEYAKQGLGNVGQFAVDLGVGATQLASDIGLGLLTGGSALAPMAVRSFGGGFTEAFEDDATKAQALAYGLLNAGVELGTEKLWNIGKPLTSAFGKGVLGEGSEVIASDLAKRIANTNAGQKFARNALTTGMAAVSEGAEEAIATAVNPFLKQLTYKYDEPLELAGLDEMGRDFLLGAILGGGMTGVYNTFAGQRALAEPQNSPVQRGNVESNIEIPQAFQSENNLNQSHVDEVYKSTIKQLNPQGQKAYAENYKADTGIDEYTHSFLAYHSLGQRNIPFEKAVEANKSVNEYITEEVARAAYNAGKSNIITEGKGQIFDNRTIKQNDTKELEGIAKALKVDIVIEDTLGTVNKDNEWVDDISNGMYINGKLYLSGSAEQGLYKVAKHELTHSLKVKSPETYSRYEKYVSEMLGAEEVAARKNAIANVYTKRGLVIPSDDVLLEEVCSDFTEELFNSPEKLQDLLSKDKTIIDKLAEFLVDIIKRIGGNTKLAEIEELWVRMAKESVDGETIDTKKRNAVNSRGSESSNTSLRDTSVSKKIKPQSEETVNENTPKYSLKSYTENQIKNWSESKSIVVYKNETQLRNFIRDALAKRNLEKKMYFGAIQSELAERIKKETGIDVDNYNCTLRASEVRKIIDDHGNEESERLRGQRAITEDDFIVIPEVITSPDIIKLSDSLYEGKPVIEFIKTIKGRTTVVTYVSRKHRDLTVQTMFSGQEKKNLASAADEQASANTSETHVGTVLNNKVSQYEVNVNEKLSIKGDTARWTSTRIDKLYKEYASSSPNYSKAYATFINPEDFLSLTTTKLSNIERQSRPLNIDDLAETQPIYLAYHPDYPGEVYGHEGRHRMVALRDAGVKNVAIVVEFRGEEGKYNRQPIDSLELTGEEFGSGKAPGRVTLTNLIPISQTYRSQIEETFGAQESDIKYSLKTDSDGVALSEQQSKYFGKHGIKDENGNLLVLYRSADGNRTVWDGRGEGVDATGIYLTDNMYVARAFASNGRTIGPILEVYARAENPLIVDAKGESYISFPMPENAPEWLVKTGDWEGNLNADRLPFAAFDNGHDAVIIKNVREGVGGEPSTDVILKDSNQMKQTDNQNPTSNLDIRYSVKTDSQGKTLTENQVKYFKDSKVRDENGNLKVVYHGTRNADFTVFNRTANYYTDNQRMAESYSPTGGMYTGYLNITNPYVIDAKGDKWSGIAVDDETVNLLRKSGSSVFNERGAWRTSVADIVSAISDLVDEGEADYDGVIVLNVNDTGSYYEGSSSNVGNDYIAFNSNQFKNIDNQNPTENPDIRYSVKRQELAEPIDTNDSIKYSYDELVKKSDVTVPIVAKRTVPTKGKKIDVNELAKEARENGTHTIGSERGQQKYVYVKDIDSNVLITSDGIKHGSLGNITNKSAIETATISYELPNIIKNSIAVNELESRSGNPEEYSYVMFGLAAVEDGELYLVRTIVNHFDSNKSIVEDVEIFNVHKGSKAKKIEAEVMSSHTEKTAASVSNTSVPINISVEDLLEIVKENYPEYLSNSVLEHFGVAVEKAPSVVYSLKARDKEYMEAVNSGDIETARKLVIEYAESKGYFDNDDYRIGHTAPVAQIDKEYFTDLDALQELADESWDVNLFAIANGISLAPDDYFSPVGARYYGYNDAEGMDSYRVLRNAILSIQRQMREQGEVTEMPTLTIYRAVPKNVKEGKMQSGGQWVTPSKDYARKHGLSLFGFNEYRIIEEVVSAENLWWDGNDIREWGFDDGKTYAYKNTKNNRKSLAPIVYDDNGEVIPLSKRFNSRNSDERFSIKGQKEYAESAIRLEKINKQLKEQLEKAKAELKVNDRITLNENQINRYANELLDETHAQIDKADVRKELSELYDFMANNNDYEQAESMAYAIAEKLVENAEIEIETDAYYEMIDLVSAIKTTTFKISETDAKEVAYYFDNKWSNFTRRYKNKVKVEKDNNSNIEELYSNLAEEYPNLFDENIAHPAEMVLEICNFVDNVSKVKDNPYRGFELMAIDSLKLEIMDKYFDIKETKTFAEKALAKKEKEKIAVANKKDKEIERQKALREKEKGKAKERAEKTAEKNKAQKEEAKEKFKEQQKARKEKYSEDLKAEKEKRKRLLAEARDKRKRDLKLQREKFEQQKVKREETASRSKRISQIRKIIKDLDTRLRRPTDTKYIPEPLKQSLLDFLASVDLTTDKQSDKTKLALSNLREEYRKMADGAYSGEGIYVDIDPEIIQKMVELQKSFDKPIGEMDRNEIESLYQMCKAVKHTVVTASRMLGEERKAQVAELGDSIISELNDKRARRLHNPLMNALDRHYNFDSVTPQAFFEDMGETLNKLYQDIRKGLDEKVVMLRQAADYIGKISKGMKIDEWSKETHTFELSSGEISLTNAEIMSLYLLSKREQALLHIYEGGIKKSPKVTKDKTKGKEIKREAPPLKVTPSDVAKILNTLTAEQKKVADAMGNFLTNEQSKWVNKTTQILYGYSKATEKNYWPIFVDKNYVSTNWGTTYEAFVTQQGFLKSVTPNANNPLIIEDAFTVFTKAIDDASTFSAYAVPMSNMRKVLNYKVQNSSSVKESIQRVTGQNGIRYIQNLMADLNGGINPNNGSEILNLLLRRYKTYAMALNISAILQQPTAYLRAYAMMDAKYLARGAVHKGNAEEMKKYAPIAIWKEWGYFTNDVGRSLVHIVTNKKTLSDKMFIPMQELDNLAWRKLWEAVKLEQADLHPEMSIKSEEFLTLCGQRFSEIVDKTQVVDTIMHRTQSMRSNDGVQRAWTSFMSEPLKSYNLLRSEVKKCAANNTAKNRKSLLKHVIGFATSTAGAAAMASLVQTIRNYDPDDDDDDRIEKFLDSFKSRMFSSAGIEPLSNTVLSMAEGYRQERMEFAAIATFFKASQKLLDYSKAIATGEEPKNTPLDIMKDTINAVGQITGTPTQIVTRDVYTLLQAINRDNYLWLYSCEKAMRNVKIEANRRYFYDALYRAYVAGDTESYNIIKQDLLANGYTKDNIKNAMVYRVKGTIEKTDEIKEVSGLYEEYFKINNPTAEQKRYYSDAIKKELMALVEEGYSENYIKSVQNKARKEAAKESKITLEKGYKYYTKRNDSEKDAQKWSEYFEKLKKVYTLDEIKEYFSRQ